MKTLKFTVEKNADGFSAYREEAGNNLIAAMGNTVPELKKEIVEAYNLYKSDHPSEQITLEQVVLNYDLSSFFEFYKEINASAIGKRAGINKSLLSDYVNGKRKPSDKQVNKVLFAVKAFAKELTELEMN